MNKLLLSLVLVLGISFSAKAQESAVKFHPAYSDWSVEVSVAGWSGGPIVYKTDNPDIVRFLGGHIFHASRQHAVSTQLINCRTRMRQVLKVTVYDNNDNIVSQNNNPQSWFMGSGAVDDGVYRLVCSATPR